MYRALINGNPFYASEIDQKEWQILSGKITTGLNQAGSFTFTISNQNNYYGEFHKLKDYVEVYKADAFPTATSGELLFSGRVYSITKNFNMETTIVCEGMLAVLNDSILRPFTHEGSFAELINVIIENHNSQVDASKQLAVGTIEIDDDVVYREYQMHASSMSRILDLQSTYGGYYRIRKENGTFYFDWLAELSELAEQAIDFGVNELSNYQEESAAEIITALIPLGAEQTDEEENISTRLTIGSVNGGVDYIEADSSYIAQYGRIVGTCTWDDVTIPAILLSKAQEYLNSKLQSKVTISVDAVDLHDAGYDIETFHVGQKIKVNSEPHGINGEWFDLVGQTLDILNPASNKITLSATRQGYIEYTFANEQRNLNAIKTITANYVTTEAVKRINELADDVAKRYSTIETSIEDTGESILASVDERIQEVDGSITTLSGKIEQTARDVNLYFGENGLIKTWFTFDENYFSIHKSGQSVYSRQDNDSYEFCDASNNTLVTIDTNGLTAPTANVSGQLRFTHESTPQWAIRKGKYITNKGVNLDDVWVG